MLNKVFRFIVSMVTCALIAQGPIYAADRVISAPTGGNVVIGSPLSPSAGIKFPSLVSDADTLDYYGEGNWTPVIEGIASAGTGTYTVQNGYYTRIGRIVHFNFRVAWSAHTGTGKMRITGLPFTAASSTNNYSTGIISNYFNLTVPAGTLPSYTIPPNNSRMDLEYLTSGNTANAALDIDTSADIVGFGTYMTTF